MGAKPFGCKGCGMVKIRDLGVLEGDVLLFGGPYSNLQALRALMDWADRAQIPSARRICTGDVVAYCGDPLASIALMQKSGAPVVAGNCEIQLAQSAEDCGCGFKDGTLCSSLSVDWYNHANARLSAADRAWLGACPDRLTFRHNDKRYVVIHGGAGDVSRFIWPITPEDDFWHEISLLQEEIGAFDGVIAGHCGIAFERRVDGFHWINAGSIGMPPHDGQPETAFVVLGQDGPRFERLAYDVDGAVKAMERAGLQQGYQDSLRSGYWPSEDVLPKAMRR
jgi:predicted phosphodiesterase